MKKTIPLLGLLLLQACASTYVVPISRLYSSENEGKGMGSLLAGIHTSNEVTLTTDVSTTLVRNSTHEVENKTTVGGYGAYGVADFLDLGASLDLNSAPVLFAKFQLLGDPKKDAKEGNFSFSIAGGIGLNDSSTKESSAFGNSGTLKKENSGLYEVAPTFGYRISPESLFIIGGSYYYRGINISQTLTNPSTSGNYTEKARMFEAHVGYEARPSIDKEGKGLLLKANAYRAFLNSLAGLHTTTTLSLDLGVSF